MKASFLITLLAACLLACNSPQNATTTPDEVNGPPFQKISFKGGLKGIKCTHMADKYDEWRGQYKVQAMIVHTGHRRYKYMQLNASYLNASGKEVAQSVGGPGYELMPGDSALIETGWLFTSKDSLPNKVVLTVSNF
ncbi:hypothetical protein [Mucilaginibacter sp. FT3.2]|uniref:hypothetical protein n=1 Tax=Mucilaginibacter sp. FT3.2 TaxID=2723090 RepID=UPI001612BBFD|nr:hypothetical protein [Mucilaginibacter sp. FT3.2]MBB6231418.1 hypothetical protein [Mucilaginibacter sp. FT3.2]